MRTRPRFQQASTWLLILGLAAAVGACSDDDEANNGTANNSNNVATDAGDDMGGADMGPADMGGEDMGPADMGGEDMGPADMGGEDMGTDMGTPLEGYVIFDDALGDGLAFETFVGATNDISVSQDEAFSGTSSLKITVPAEGFAGGAYYPPAPVDLSAYNALRFQVKASKAATLNTVGIGNDAFDTNQQAERGNIALTTEWQEVIFPIPDPALATSMTGLMHFAEGAEGPAYDIYLDEVAYVSVDPSTFTNASAAFANVSQNLFTGQTTKPPGTVFNLEVNGVGTTIGISPFWFSWMSSDTAVATVDDDGLVTGVAPGSAQITGTFAGEAAGGQFTVNVSEGPPAPAMAPTTPEADVEASVYSNTYTDVPVNTYSAGFSAVAFSQIVVDGNDILLYASLDFAAIEMVGPNSIDITDSTTMHIDIWTPNAAQFSIKLVDFGANNVYNGPFAVDDTEAQVDLFTSNGDFTNGQWVTLELPLADFTTLANRANLSQIIFVGRADDGAGNLIPGVANIFVDNIYFY